MAHPFGFIERVGCWPDFEAGEEYGRFLAENDTPPFHDKTVKGWGTRLGFELHECVEEIIEEPACIHPAIVWEKHFS